MKGNKCYFGKKNRKPIRKLILALLVIFLSATGKFVLIDNSSENIENIIKTPTVEYQNDELTDLVYNGEIAVKVNGNTPDFSNKEKGRAATEEFEEYSNLDSLGRCGAATATICKEIQPAKGEKRTSLGSVTPSGWQRINFWSRCHLIGYQLAGENANEKNLITGTGRMNSTGMLPYENDVRDYLWDNPDNHVLYRVEPVFKDDNLIASGVHMQAWSVEDDGDLSFNVYIFNYQPGYIIDYKSGYVEDDPEHQTVIALEDKTSSYTGRPILINDAVVDGSTGKIRYIYYYDEDCHNKTDYLSGAATSGSAPTERGRYYVRAVVEGDNWYPTAASNTAELEII